MGVDAEKATHWSGKQAILDFEILVRMIDAMSHNDHSIAAAIGYPTDRFSSSIL